MRRADWEMRVHEVIERHRAASGDWGVSDCWILSAEAFHAQTGAELLPDLRGYRSERAGYRLFAKHGFASVGEALAFALPAVGRYQARRGDLAVIERNGLESCGVITAMGLAVKTLYGDEISGRICRAPLEFHSLDVIKRAFLVG